MFSLMPFWSPSYLPLGGGYRALLPSRVPPNPLGRHGASELALQQLPGPFLGQILMTQISGPVVVAHAYNLCYWGS